MRLLNAVKLIKVADVKLAPHWIERETTFFGRKIQCHACRENDFGGDLVRSGVIDPPQSVLCDVRPSFAKLLGGKID